MTYKHMMSNKGEISRSNICTTLNGLHCGRYCGYTWQHPSQTILFRKCMWNIWKYFDFTLERCVLRDAYLGIFVSLIDVIVDFSRSCCLFCVYNENCLLYNKWEIMIITYQFHISLSGDISEYLCRMTRVWGSGKKSCLDVLMIMKMVGWNEYALVFAPWTCRATFLHKIYCVAGQLEPEVTFLSLGIVSENYPEFTTTLPIDRKHGDVLFTLKEGSDYRLKLTFRVKHNIVLGLSYSNTVWKGGFQGIQSFQIFSTRVLLLVFCFILPDNHSIVKYKTACVVKVCRLQITW